MLRSYFLMAWRSLVKNKVSSIINIGGLSVGLATGIIILLVILNEFSYDTFHANRKDLYTLMKKETVGSSILAGRQTPGPLAEVVRAEIPEVKYAARTNDEGGQLIAAGDKSIYKTVLYTDPDLLNMMSFPAVEGDPVAALKDPGSVVITESTARALFGKEEALGKTLVRNNKNVLKVAAILRDIPENSTLQFDLIIPFHLFEMENQDWVNKWDNNRIQTWIQTQPNVSLAALNAKLKASFLARQDADGQHTALFAYPLLRLRLHGQFKNGEEQGGQIMIMLLLSLTAGFVLLIACINFMNLATARSERRAKEVGVRKVLGASRGLVILQFLSESLLFAFLAMGLGILLAKVALPGFMSLSGKNFTPDFGNWRLWVILVGLALLTGLIAGSYPAFYLSRFRPVKVLKNWVPREKGGGLLRRGLVTFQFCISIFLIISTLVIYRQMDYLEHRPIGYNADNLIDIPTRGKLASRFDIFRNELLQVAGVKDISAGTDNLIRYGGAFNGLEWPGKTPDQDFYISSTVVQYDWVKTTGLTLAAGRDFRRDYGADSSACLINETAARRMHLENPVGTRLGGNTVIGLIHDFVLNDASGTPPPIIVFLGKGGMNHIFLRIANDEHWQDCLAKIEKVVKENNPGFPFEFQFVREEYQHNFERIRAIARMSNIFGMMAIFISCMGLFGLSAFVAERRGKEIGIRKVLGATPGSLWLSLSKDFLKPVIIAYIITTPLTVFAMQQLLNSMDYHIGLPLWVFGLAGAIAIFIALATVSFNGLKATLANPVEALRSE